MTRKVYNYFLLTVLSMFLCFSGKIYSYPKFSAYTGSKCQSCHVNPTGGGMRNQSGVLYSKENLFLKQFKKANKTTDIDPQISKGLRMGGDMRAAYFDIQRGAQTNLNTFFQMQADLYVSAQVNKYICVTIAPGLYIPNTFDPNPLPVKYEVFGLVSNLPANLYFKVGRFIPNFGTRIPEHRAYNRLFNDLYTPYAADAGIEVGIAPGPFTLTAGLSNGSSANKDGQVNNSFDFDTQKQFTVSADFRWKNSEKKVKYTFGLGGSFITNPFQWDKMENVNALRQVAAGFFSVGLFQRVAILGELTYNRLKLRDSVSSQFDVKTIFGEVDIRAIPGLELKFQYENYNPALGIKNDVSKRQRYSFGLLFYPLTGLEVEGTFRVVKEGKGDGPVPFNLKNNEFQTVFKFYF